MSQDYLNPLNRMKWQAAFKRRTPVTTIGGVRYQLRYYINNEGEACVYFKPAKGFVPAGHFKLSRVLTEEWLSQDG